MNFRQAGYRNLHVVRPIVRTFVVATTVVAICYVTVRRDAYIAAAVFACLAYLYNPLRWRLRSCRRDLPTDVAKQTGSGWVRLSWWLNSWCQKPESNSFEIWFATALDEIDARYRWTTRRQTEIAADAVERARPAERGALVLERPRVAAIDAIAQSCRRGGVRDDSQIWPALDAARSEAEQLMAPESFDDLLDRLLARINTARREEDRHTTLAITRVRRIDVRARSAGHHYPSCTGRLAAAGRHYLFLSLHGWSPSLLYKLWHEVEHHRDAIVRQGGRKGSDIMDHEFDDIDKPASEWKLSLAERTQIERDVQLRIPPPVSLFAIEREIRCYVPFFLFDPTFFGRVLGVLQAVLIFVVFFASGWLFLSELLGTLALLWRLLPG